MPRWPPSTWNAILSAPVGTTRSDRAGPPAPPPTPQSHGGNLILDEALGHGRWDVAGLHARQGRWLDGDFVAHDLDAGDAARDRLGDLAVLVGEHLPDDRQRAAAG